MRRAACGRCRTGRRAPACAGRATTGRPGGGGGAGGGVRAVRGGTGGAVVLGPGDKALERGREALAAFARERAKLSKLRRLPAVTTDGAAAELQANLEIPAQP